MNTNVQLSPEEYAHIRSFLEESCGIVLGENKQYLVTSRLRSVMADNGIFTFKELTECLSKDKKPGLKEKIIDAMTTNETMWFRDIYPFEALQRVILPELAEARKASLRFWSAACSTGQEPYSISIAVQEFLAGRFGAFPEGVSITGTDISPSVLKEARAATYDDGSVARGLSDERRQRYFRRHEDKWVVAPEVRERVSFTELNLLKNFSLLGRFDIIFCRNVLIYFSHEIKADILNRMAQVMNPGGYLILGGSEAPTSYTTAFEMVKSNYGVVYRLKPKEARAV